MNKAIKNIGKYFSKFEIIEFQIDSRNEKIDFDLIEFECSIREKLWKFEKDLQLFYLEGNDLVLKRVKKELLKIEESLKQKNNVGIHFRIEETGSIHSIEPGLLDSISEIKLKYSNELISIINYFLGIGEDELSFTNTFDDLSPKEIYSHFKSGLVDKKYLTELELKKYLKAAFELKKAPEQFFKIENSPKKQLIIRVFYNYYKNVAGKPHGKQREYAALLGDYFEGYNTELIKTNFSK